MSSKVLFLAPQPYFRLRGVCLAEQICLEVLFMQAADVLVQERTGLCAAYAVAERG